MILCWIVFCALQLCGAVEVNLTSDWRAGSGWELRCSWRFDGGDRLQSARMYRDDAQFNVFKPRTHGRRINNEWHLPHSYMHMDCIEREPREGSCTLSIEITQQYSDNVKYSCVVSGEGPKFFETRKDLLLEAYVPSNDATIEASARLAAGADRVQLNCSATGLPAPTLSWTVGHQKMDAPSSSQWNSTTRLHHSWSSLALSPRPGALPVRCTPAQTTRRGVALGPAADFTLEEISNAANIFRDKYILHLLAAIILLR